MNDPEGRRPPEPGELLSQETRGSGHGAVHPPPLPLDYGTGRDNRTPPWEPPGYVPHTPLWTQFLLGFFGPYVACAGSVYVVSRFDRMGMWTVWSGFLAIVAVAILGAVARARYGWRGFIPGMMTSLGLVALIFSAGVFLCFKSFKL